MLKLNGSFTRAVLLSCTTLSASKAIKKAVFGFSFCCACLAVQAADQYTPELKEYFYTRIHDLVVTTPTQGGGICAIHSTGEYYSGIQFDVNLGLNWFVELRKNDFKFLPKFSDLFDLEKNRTEMVNILGLSGYYLSSYEFRLLDVYSEPVISKKQNPQGELFFERIFRDKGYLKSHYGVGFAHLSNGQYANSEADLAKLDEIDGSLGSQSFASMGCNYGFIRLAYNVNATSEYKPAIPFLEYRLYTPGPNDDVNSTDLTIHEDGLRAYDGLRMGLILYQNETSFEKVQFILPSNFGADYFDSAESFIERCGLDATVYFTFASIPVYFNIQFGCSSSFAWYFVPTSSVSFGVTVPTTYFANGDTTVNKMLKRMDTGEQ